MAEVAAGDRGAFSCLTRRHVPGCLRVAARIVGNAHDAEEIVQESLLQVWRHASDWRGDGARVGTWLYRIVVNRAISHRRKRRFEPLDAALEVPDSGPDPQAETEARDLAARAEAAIAALPDRQKAALSLCCYEGLTCAESAQVLGVSVSTMESLLVRARRAVRKSLDMPERSTARARGRKNERDRP
ncbi:sigma-70 family RNA polymerase sigma factor [Roseospira visakhapatnamensis]|uniref:RNA polymerase sigma factor n=1 Tax=Roseospira visakhapatnamensis TaxID=390880 RepID=A0A7W6RA47_9PROT|nr:sigma-70 family RNA polymerase sigma factor [Roseospira visakhapatnamensis]MBB4264697.1 RNA polymerase sigma-70 factor (ECF subfamily) [Roseospira visakhapatnamensis]